VYDERKATPPRGGVALLGNRATQTASPRTASLSVYGNSAQRATERWRRDPGELRDEWVRLLDGILVAGRRPTSTSDYLFIFESIRRALEA